MEGESNFLKGKTALVTGGSRGIGKAIVLELARRGADVAFNYLRHHSAARKTLEEIEELGVKGLMIRAHLQEPRSIVDLFAKVQDQLGRLDILVNNAASGVQRSSMSLKVKHWDWTLDINTRAPWLCAREAVRLMTYGGKIINITSPGSQRVLPHYFAVGISKAGLEALTRYLAIEYAPKGISVNAVAGGYVETEALESFPDQNDVLAKARGGTPAGRMVTADDIANAVAFLCSDQSEMIRGQIIVVDGGMTLGV